MEYLKHSQDNFSPIIKGDNATIIVNNYLHATDKIISIPYTEYLELKTCRQQLLQAGSYLKNICLMPATDFSDYMSWKNLPDHIRKSRLINGNQCCHDEITIKR